MYFTSLVFATALAANVRRTVRAVVSWKRIANGSGGFQAGKRCQESDRSVANKEHSPGVNVHLCRTSQREPTLVLVAQAIIVYSITLSELSSRKPSRSELCLLARAEANFAFLDEEGNSTGTEIVLAGRPFLHDHCHSDTCTDILQWHAACQSTDLGSQTYRIRKAGRISSDAFDSQESKSLVRTTYATLLERRHRPIEDFTASKARNHDWSSNS